MEKLTVVLIPDGGASTTKQYCIPKFMFRGAYCLILIASSLTGYFALDYIQLTKIRSSYEKVVAENAGLKGEARLLMNNLEDVKRSLLRVQDYSEKLSEITNLQVNKVSKRTGIGPLTKDEYSVAKNLNSKHSKSNEWQTPLGINMNKLIFRPVFNSLRTIGNTAHRNALELQTLLSSLSKQKSLLSSIPSITPVQGWMTSSFGYRISPFTGRRTMHKGIDVAAPIGTPILAPADGVVIFTGAKAGFGNFVMIAHGYGVVTRYGHNAQNMVQPGQRIKRGDQIGTVGMTGRTTGPHLHYEILLNGRNVNPKRFILDMH